ncbi:hypothetical protein C0V97_12310 [Asaia sp. W19]|uniref:hypothetical protein n=1 Tax=unclassified Asaia TaxID=2685023 RepID=UPI000F8D2A75|nr:hypothetical protein [Asaia sp. W19]RUT25359.1 hypothetical protein C0V97_12310 [Asaia sp. W19]
MTNEQKPESAEFRTREAQTDALARAIGPEKIFHLLNQSYREEIMARASSHVLEAEARGAAEQRRKDAEDAEGAEPVGWQYQNAYGDWHPILKGSPEWYIRNGSIVRPIYTRPANVAALEVRVKELEGEVDRRISEAVAAERERCAKMLDASAIRADEHGAHWGERYAKCWAAAIREGV